MIKKLKENNYRGLFVLINLLSFAIIIAAAFVLQFVSYDTVKAEDPNYYSPVFSSNNIHSSLWDDTNFPYYTGWLPYGYYATHSVSSSYTNSDFGLYSTSSSIFKYYNGEIIDFDYSYTTEGDIHNFTSTDERTQGYFEIPYIMQNGIFSFPLFYSCVNNISTNSQLGIPITIVLRNIDTNEFTFFEPIFTSTNQYFSNGTNLTGSCYSLGSNFYDIYLNVNFSTPDSSRYSFGICFYTGTSSIYSLNYIRDYLTNYENDYFIKGNINILKASDFYYSNLSDNIYYNKGYEDGFNDYILTSDYRQAIQDAYNNGQAAGSLQHNNFLSLMSAVVNAPISALLSIFDIEILGYNMKNLLSALLTISLIFFIIKFISGHLPSSPAGGGGDSGVSITETHKDGSTIITKHYKE